MKKFQFDGEWWVELDPKKPKLFNMQRCLITDEQGQNPMWNDNDVLVACVDRNGCNFITEWASWDRCAIPCPPPKTKVKKSKPKQRMTNLQLLHLLASGGWLARSPRGMVYAGPQFWEKDLGEIVRKGVNVSRTIPINWIEPTTDLLEQSEEK